ncbi:MAG: (E)-4-hydroxy-3-methylbut-2-enyl-diphosphate synthase [Elusimicrobia bacterium]|nr:MAG: (E)-4-hydroxy-3-methylbut-2-enyl-diphosphate synthase [Elusimicrobiota bacterium]KAF0155166.1 MAG: (E)-4-hydroxy-3-methylbut-2-enyl-diphosphate synthase [Elusimicrobiota bacterium]
MSSVLAGRRRRTRQIKAGSVRIGGGAPISVQSMCNTRTEDARATVDQCRRLEAAGCELIRVAVPDMAAARKLGRIKAALGVPLVADIHFDHALALEAVRQGADKIRINPGNIGDRSKVAEVARACKAAGVPIRIGVNAGSLKAIRNSPRPRWTAAKWAAVMVKEALDEVRVLECLGFRDIAVSLKADDLDRTVLANRLFARRCDIPLHLGVTEAGSALAGTVKSSAALSLLLADGIGDTVRVSLTEAPALQVRAAYEILKAFGLREYGPDLVACPTCGRCQVNVEKTVKEVENAIYSSSDLLRRSTGMKIAVMGCVVNGPGEARSADFGVAGGKGRGVWIEKGKQIKVVKEKEWVREIIRKIRSAR